MQNDGRLGHFKRLLFYLFWGSRTVLCYCTDYNYGRGIGDCVVCFTTTSPIASDYPACVTARWERTLPFLHPCSQHIACPIAARIRNPETKLVTAGALGQDLTVLALKL